MAEDFGNGVSRTLSAKDRAFVAVVWQADKPPLDSELNLVAQVDWERAASAVRAQMHSGFLLDPFNADADYVTSDTWSNFFKLGRQAEDDISPVLWANVNGWVVPVTGTAVSDGDTSNRINLYPGPTTDRRIDFVFLEVWMAQVAPNPSTGNKPSASAIYKYGNVKFGGTNIPDDLEDPTIGFETTERVQLQYRLRVVGQGAGLGVSVDLAAYPDGIDDPNVLAQGTSGSPVVGYPFTNMREELGDPGLWRSGDGDAENELGTVDGYVYAIPVCAIFRRNTTPFSARTNAGNANQNGALDRNPRVAPIVDPVEGTRIFSSITLVAGISETTTGVVQVTGLAGSGFDNLDIDWTSVFLQIDEEIIGIDSVNTGPSPGTITIRASGGRGRFATQAVPHAAGSEVRFYNFRQDGLFADQIAPTDILDLRKGVTQGEWDYEAILTHNLGKLFSNTLHTTFKQSGVTGGDVEGVVIPAVDTLYANGGTSVPNQTEALDGPDGIRTVFSDAVVVESGVSVFLSPATGGVSPTSVASYTAGAGSWGPAADFDPDGFQPNGGGWANQTVINLNIGSSSLNGGARATVRTSANNRIVRFLTPKEYWLSRSELLYDDQEGLGTLGNQTPFKLRFLSESWGEPAAASEVPTDHPGPMYPLPEHNFERPFIVLGGVVNTNLRTTLLQTLAAGSSPAGYSTVRIAGQNFNTAGLWYATAAQSLETEGVTNLLLYGKRNLFDMLTAGGRDLSGLSSELYLVITGDAVNSGNNGVWRVIGAGTAGYTNVSAGAATDLVVARVGEGSSALIAAVGLSGTVRSQYTHTDDGSSVGAGASAVVVITDLEAVAGSQPWAGLVSSSPIDSRAVLDTSLIYGPSRGGTARVASPIHVLGMVGTSTAEMVREAPSAIDPNFDNESGVPSNERYFSPNAIQTWNRLPSLGLAAPSAPSYGDGGLAGEYRREAELFVDEGSKTLVIRPYQRTDLSLHRHQTTGRLIPLTYSAGSSLGVTVDGGNLFTTDADYAYAFPNEWMPRFGRQDIPFVQTTGITGPVYFGINHLFGDSLDNTDDVFRVIGGVDSSSTVSSIWFETGLSSPEVYGEYFNLAGSANGYKARIYEDVNVISSDLPRGLRGIQLPPYLGIARLYGVYDRRDFSGLGAWNSDRVTPSAAIGRPPNLLRRDADRQTLFIVKGGAQDVTGNENDHTYVIPSDVIDVRLSNSYIDGENFDDVEYVVEAMVFGFGRGFINQNNYILARDNLPTGDTATSVAALASQVSCVLPLPLPYNEQLYVLYSRTVYQGDPFMTRGALSGPQQTDYRTRYGQIPQSSAIGLATPIQQYDASNDFVQVPEIPNARSLEILASVDFYTTLGTGKIGGRVYAGTLTDVGHFKNDDQTRSRVPPSASTPAWQSEGRAYTQGASEEASRSSLTIMFQTDSTTSANQTIRVSAGDTTVNLVSNVDFTGVTPTLTASDFASEFNSNAILTGKFQLRATWNGSIMVTIWSVVPGELSVTPVVTLVPSGALLPTGFTFDLPGKLPGTVTRSPLLGGSTPPMNGKVDALAISPMRLTGLTERLPLGILLQDSDFIGEDPLKNGASSLFVRPGSSISASNVVSPILNTVEYGRVQGGGHIGMADGAILEYVGWTILQPGGTRYFRLFRGGGSAYVLDPTPAGGPLDWVSDGFGSEMEPVVKGSVLCGRAYLVRNYFEEAYSLPLTRSYGDEVQMVIVTQGITGHGPECGSGYALDGQISPTGYGEGWAAADRYRVEGRPLVPGHSKVGPDPDVELAPYPSEDPVDPNPC